MTVSPPAQRTKHYITQLEKVQRRAARFVNKNYHEKSPGCVEKMMKELNWESLQHRRTEKRLIMFYKIDKQMVDIKKETYLQKGDSRTRGAHKFHQARSQHPALTNSFFIKTVKEWNNLPSSLTAVPSLEAFSAGLGAALHQEGPRH